MRRLFLFFVIISVGTSDAMLTSASKMVSNTFSKCFANAAVTGMFTTNPENKPIGLKKKESAKEVLPNTDMANAEIMRMANKGLKSKGKLEDGHVGTPLAGIFPIKHPEPEKESSKKESSKGAYCDFFKEFHKFEDNESDKRKSEAEWYIKVGRYPILFGLINYIVAGDSKYTTNEKQEKSGDEEESYKKIRNTYIACCVHSGVLLQLYGLFRKNNMMPAVTNYVAY